MPNGFMQSIMILPARLPRLLIAASAADQGVAITTTSACLMASAGALTRSLGSAACFGSAGLRTPQLTSSPCLIQARPTVAPTDPAPMIAIRMNTSWFCTRTNQAFSTLDQKRAAKKMALETGARSGPLRRHFPRMETKPYLRNAAVPRGLSGIHMLARGDRTCWLTMQSAANQSPHQIPCYRENNREFRKIRRSTAIFVSDQCLHSIAYGQNSLRNGTGNF